MKGDDLKKFRARMQKGDRPDTAKIRSAQNQFNADRGVMRAKIVSIPKAMAEGKAFANKDLRAAHDHTSESGGSHLAVSSPNYKKMPLHEQLKVDRMVAKMRKGRD